VPVAGVRWWGEDERWFGVPYLIVERLPGRSGNRWNLAGDGAPMSPDTFRQAVEALVAIHGIPWTDVLADWAEPRDLTTEIHAWERALAKADDPDWIRQGLELRDALLASRPAEPTPGIVHGDFYPNNWMFDGGRLTGIVDWEIAAIGPSLMDIGWLCAFHDPQSWAPGQIPPPAWGIDPEALGAMYEAAAGRAVEDLQWYQALASWRFGAITALNVHLHRSGRRPDPFWDDTAKSFPYLISRGLALLARPVSRGGV
jgi:aminoglycoside phosphotransferase (APT) family kinase protein